LLLPPWIRKLAALPRADRRILAVVSVMMVAVQTALSTMSFKSVAEALAKVSGESASSSSAGSTERIAWAVAAVGRRMPGTSCLVEALVGHTLLSRAGISSELKIGVLNQPAFEAHAWVVVGDKVVIGASDKAFVELPLDEATF
jgi:hypothetical protein